MLTALLFVPNCLWVIFLAVDLGGRGNSLARLALNFSVSTHIEGQRGKEQWENGGPLGLRTVADLYSGPIGEGKPQGPSSGAPSGSDSFSRPSQLFVGDISL